MREIYYNSDITPRARNEIKLLTLYYDKIHIVSDAVYAPKFEKLNNELKFSETENLRFIPPSFEVDYKLLIDENIVSVTSKTDDDNEEYKQRFSAKISNILNSSYDLIFPKHPIESGSRIVTEEVYDIM